MKNFFACLLSCLFALLIAFSISAFDILDETDPMWVMDFNEDQTSWQWVQYDSLQAYADAFGVALAPASRGEIDESDILLFYRAILGDEDFKTSLRFVNEIAHVDWGWMQYPHVHFLDYPEHLNNQSFHPPSYLDLIFVIQDLGYAIDGQEDESVILIALLDRMQEMVDAARRAWELDIFPGSPPPAWEMGIEVEGGTWYQYGDTFDYYVAKIDIHRDNNTRSPDISSAFRLQSQRRYLHPFDANDLYLELKYEDTLADLGDTEIHIDYETNTVYMHLSDSVTIEAFNNTPRHGIIAADIDGEDVWYAGRVNHRAFNTDTFAIEFRTDPIEEKDEFADESVVIVQLEQGASAR